MSDIKRLADAYRDAYLAHGGPTRGNLPRQAIAEAHAIRAVLESLREPSEGMLAAGINAEIEYGEEPYAVVCDYIDSCEEVAAMGAWERDRTQARRKWTDAFQRAILRAHIDHLLSESP